MTDNLTEQAIVVTAPDTIVPGQGVTRLRLFNEDGSPLDLGDFPQGVAVSDITTANATDLTTAQALANANKAKINALLASLRGAGLIAE